MSADLAAARPKRPLSFSEHVCETLRDDILSGRLPGGSRLTEAYVMERTGVSRTPVREGLRRLEAEGLVTTHRHRGAFVTLRLTGAEALVIYDVRLVLEPQLTRLAAERVTPEELAALREILERFEVASEPAEASRVDADFHMTIYEASGSELLNVVRGYWTRIELELSKRVYTTEIPRRFVREHRTIMRALERGDALHAQESMAAHIEHGRRSLVKNLTSRTGEGETRDA